MKSLSGPQLTALQAEHAIPIIFAEFDWGGASGTRQYCTAGYNFDWSARTWVGLGGLVTLEPIKETADTEAVGLKASLPGFSTTTGPNPVSLALSEHVQGRPCSMWLGLLDGAYQLIGEPVLEFKGRIDTVTIVEEQGSATLVVSMESKFASFLRPRVRRFTDADQQRAYPGDKFFEYVAKMKEQAIVFPSKEAMMR